MQFSAGNGPLVFLVRYDCSLPLAKPARAAICEVSALSGFATIGAKRDISTLHKGGHFYLVATVSIADIFLPRLTQVRPIAVTRHI